MAFSQNTRYVPHQCPQEARNIEKRPLMALQLYTRLSERSGPVMGNFASGASAKYPHELEYRHLECPETQSKQVG